MWRGGAIWVVVLAAPAAAQAPGVASACLLEPAADTIAAVVTVSVFAFDPEQRPTRVRQPFLFSLR